MSWNVNWLGKPPEISKAVLIEGMPGIGNVGKVAIDFLIDTLKAKKIAEFHSRQMPHSVFVNEHGLVEMPKIDLYLVKRKKGPDILLLAGDVQPASEESCYAFCELVVQISGQMKVKEIVTTGGIGLRAAPKKPKVFITGTSKDALKHYSSLRVSKDIYGTVGPIIGVSGVLCGLAGKGGIDGVTLLVEVLGHPMYVAVRGARELLRVLNGRFNLGLNLKELEKEITKLEAELSDRTADVLQVGMQRRDDINYIG